MPVFCQMGTCRAQMVLLMKLLPDPREAAARQRRAAKFFRQEIPAPRSAYDLGRGGQSVPD